MPEAGRYHVSGAIVAVLPGRTAEIRERLAALPGVEVHAAEGARLVITIEGRSAGEMGDRLTGIALGDGVIAANLVFEHSDSEEAQP